MIELSSADSVFQLAFALNSVFVILNERYVRGKHEFVRVFQSELKRAACDLDVTVDQDTIHKYLTRALLGYRLLNWWYRLTMLASMLAVAISGYLLIHGVTASDALMSDRVFRWLSIGLLFVIPAMSYAFHWYSGWAISLLKSQLRLTEDEARIIVATFPIMRLADGIGELSQEMEYLIAQIEIANWVSRIKLKVQLMRLQLPLLVQRVRIWIKSLYERPKGR